MPARTATTGPAAPPTIDTATVDALRELVTISLGEALPPLLEEHPPLRETAATLCDAVRGPKPLEDASLWPPVVAAHEEVLAAIREL